MLVKEPTCQGRGCKRPGLIPGLGRSPGEGNGIPFSYSCLANNMDRGAWLATVHGVTKIHTWLKPLSTHTYMVKFEEIGAMNHYWK